MKKGLIAYVYRAPKMGDCTNQGISSKVDQVLIYGEGIPEIFESAEDLPAMKFEPRENMSARFGMDCSRLVPDDCKGHLMFGGNFAYSSDSRLPRAPIPIHDRIE